MTRFHLGLSIFLSTLLSLLAAVNVQAEETTAVTTTTTQSALDGTVTKVVETTRKTITTPVPAPKEVIATPTGYVSCFNVEAGWFNNLWVPTHRVCQYANTGEGVAWIDSYWACNKATDDGVCTNWEWKPGRWEKTFVVY